MVPVDPKRCPGEICESLSRFVALLERDRESLILSGHHDIATALALLNVLVDEADELKKAVLSPAQPSGVSE